MPETKQSKKWIYVSIIILVVSGFILYVKYSKKEKSGIDSIVVQKTDLVQKVSVTGNIRPVDSVNLGFDISGKVSGVNVSIGDKVKTGRVLLKLEDNSLRAKLLVAQANLSQQEASLDKLKAGTRIEEINIQKVKVENARTALLDAKKNVMNKIRDAYSKSDDAVRNKTDQLFSNPRSTNPDLSIIISNNQLKTNIESSRILIGAALFSWDNMLAKLTLKSDMFSFISATDSNLYKIRDFLNNVALAVNSLTKNSSTSQTIIDGYKSDIWIARTNINNAIASITISQNNLRNAQSALTLAQNELTLKEAGATKEDIATQEARVLSAKANIDNVKALLAKTVLYSPITGIVTKVNVKVGEIVSLNSDLVSVISSDNFEIKANIAESDIEKISIGDSASVTLDSYGDSIIFKAVVSSIDPADIIIDGVPTYKTTFKLLPDGNRVKSGMTANIDILTNKKNGVIAIPARAIDRSNSDYFVKVLENNGTIITKKVETGLRGFNGRVEIVSGVKAGDRIIIYMK